MSTENSRIPRPTDPHAVKDKANPGGSAPDFDEIESFLRKEFPGQGKDAAFSDPLMAELARIVGQQGAAPPAPAAAPAMPNAADPFAAGAGAVPADPDPLRAFEEELRRFDAQTRPVVTPPSPAMPPDPPLLPAGDLVASRDYAGVPGEAVAPQPYAEPYDAANYPAGYPLDARTDVAYDAGADPYAVAPPPLPVEDVARPRNRKVLMMLGGAAALAVVGVVGAVGFRSPSTPKSGAAPVIAAKTGPVKERPADPGGMEISGQDRQVLAKKTDEPKAPATVVNKEEQPVDLNQTPKREVSRVILSAPTQGGPSNPPGAILMPPGAAQPAQPAEAATAASSPATAGGFEAKRVRSVRVSGDGEILPSNSPAPPARPTASTAAATAPVASLSPSVSAPRNEPPKSDARPATAVRQPQTTTPQRTAPAPRQAAEPADANAPMSLRPPTNTAARTAAPAATGSSGGFAVQMAAPGSEAEARSVIQRLRQRHAGVLGGQSPVVREATVNGRTVYRVRVAGLSRQGANDLCARLKADGGSCYVAGN